MFFNYPVALANSSGFPFSLALLLVVLSSTLTGFFLVYSLSSIIYSPSHPPTLPSVHPSVASSLNSALHRIYLRKKAASAGKLLGWAGRFSRMAQQVPRCPVVAPTAKEERKREGDALWQIDRYGQGDGRNKRKQLFRVKESGQRRRLAEETAEQIGDTQRVPSHCESLLMFLLHHDSGLLLAVKCCPSILYPHSNTHGNSTIPHFYSAQMSTDH